MNLSIAGENNQVNAVSYNPLTWSEPEVCSAIYTIFKFGDSFSNTLLGKTVWDLGGSIYYNENKITKFSVLSCVIGLGFKFFKNYILIPRVENSQECKEKFFTLLIDDSKKDCINQGGKIVYGDDKQSVSCIYPRFF